MKVLFEEYGYKTESIENVLGDFLLSKLDKEKEKQQLRYVGYFFNKDIENRDGSKGDLVFILPKVLLDSEGKAFGLNPEDIIDFNYKDWKKEDLVVEGGKLSKQQVYNFIYGFVTWIYRAVSLYRLNLRHQPKKGDEDDIANGVMTSLQVGQSGKKKDATFVDILLSLLNFQRTHKDFITFAIKIAHSGFNKVSWQKTIARTQAVVQDDSPIYLNTINKTRVVNFDEELLIIYYSILDYMHEEYGFPIANQPGYKLIKGAMFKSYLKSQGKTRLHKIRYKYYSDDAILLWNLCYAFFDKSDSLKANSNKKDYLLVHKFETVFEGMIDELVGDKNLPEGLKVSGDDKRIDHLYTYKYLLENLEDRSESILSHDIYNIADSKYYRRDKELRGHDVPKQFTYARNVIQWHMDLLHDLLEKDIDKAKKYKDIPLFDEVTEGYNVIPNFFISALVDEDLSYDKQDFAPSNLGDGNNVHESYFFWERLFDRNSYFTLHYDVNFLYILKMYARNKSYDKAIWKREVRKRFREGILKYLNGQFVFYQILIPEYSIGEFIERHYRKITGKVFSFEDTSKDRVLVYAERRTQPDGNAKSYTYDETKDAHVDVEDNILVIPGKGKDQLYKVVNIRLGEDYYRSPNRRVYLPKTEYEISTRSNGEYELLPNSEDGYQFGIVPSEEYALVGYYRSIEQLNWIRTNMIYNIRAQRRSKYVKMSEAEMNANYLILHNKELGTFIYAVKPVTPYLLSKEELPRSNGYEPHHNYYMVYEIEEKAESDNLLDILVQTQKFIDFTESKSPLAFKMSAIRKHAEIIPLPNLRYKFEEEDTFISMVAEDFVLNYGKKA